MEYKLAKLDDRGGDLSQQWFVYYSFQHPETRRFQRFKKYISVKCKTRKERYGYADKILNHINSKLTAGWNPFSSEDYSLKTVEEAVLFALSVKETQLRKRSVHTYRNLIKTFVEFLKEKKLASLPISAFSYKHAQMFMDWAKIEREIQNRTYNNYKSQMTTFFNFLIGREYITYNPFKKIVKVQEEEADIICFTRSEMKVIRQHLPEDNYRLWVVTQLIFYCFLRPAEIMRLRIRDINLVNQTIRVLGTTSKNKKQQVISIPDFLQDELSKLEYDAFPEDYLLFTRHLKPGAKEAAPTRIAEYWRMWANQYGIQKKIYSLKHTGVGMAIENGINVRDLQLQLRHSSLEMTQIYLDKFNNRPSDNLKKNFPRF